MFRHKPRDSKKGLRHLPEFSGGNIYPLQMLGHSPNSEWGPGWPLASSPAQSASFTRGCPTPRMLHSTPLNTPHLCIALYSCPSHLGDFPHFLLVGTWHISSSVTQSSMATGLFNGPFHTENSPYISFKTFYSIIYTFKIICNCPSCHILPPFPTVVSVVS